MISTSVKAKNSIRLSCEQKYSEYIVIKISQIATEKSRRACYVSDRTKIEEEALINIFNYD